MAATKCHRVQLTQSTRFKSACVPPSVSVGKKSRIFQPTEFLFSCVCSKLELERAIKMTLFLILLLVANSWSFEILKEDSTTAASHGTAYNSIINHYYENDPYFGPPKNRYTKDEALERLKSIIAKKKSENYNNQRMDKENTAINRNMIPAPLLARVRNYNSDKKQEMDRRHDNIEGIPAPLLVGGAYR